MFRCDRRCDGCDGKFGNFVGTKHTLGLVHNCSRVQSPGQCAKVRFCRALAWREDATASSNQTKRSATGRGDGSPVSWRERTGTVARQVYPSAVDASPAAAARCDCEVTCRRVALRLRLRRPGIHHHRASAGGGREGAGELGQWRRRRAGGWRHQHTSFRLHACGRSVDQQGSAGEPPLFTSERGWERGTGRRGVAQLTLSPTAKAEAVAHCLMPPNRPFQLIPGN